MSILQQYVDQITQDLKIDDFNVKEAQLLAPSKKHFWVAKLIKHKIELNQLEKQKKELINSTFEKIIEESPISTNHNSLKKEIENTPAIQNIVAQIKEAEILIEYLEKVEKIMSSLTFDIGNIVKILALEQT